MKQLATQSPFLGLDTSRLSDQEAKVLLESLFEQLRRLRRDIVEVVNFNAVTVVSQDGQPSPSSGEMTLWKDTDATSGQPTHYLVMNDGSSTVTFASEETVP